VTQRRCYIGSPFQLHWPPCSTNTADAHINSAALCTRQQRGPPYLVNTVSAIIPHWLTIISVPIEQKGQLPQAVRELELQFCLNPTKNVNISSLLKDLNWAPLKDRRRDIRLAMLFNIVKYNMPVQADAILLPADPRTRHHRSFKFKHILSNTAQYKHSFFVRTVPEWKSLPEAGVNADTVTAFQTQLRHTP